MVNALSDRYLYGRRRYLNRLLAKLNVSSIEDRPETWVSSTTGPQRQGGEGAAQITIGMQEVPSEVAARWGWQGTVDEQLVLKIAHECVHKFQHDGGYEQALVRALQTGQVRDEDQEFLPYVSLYLALEETGSVSGLAAEPIYKLQSENTGELKVEILEDMTELIAAYMLGDEYLFSKLSASHVSQAQAEQVAILVDTVCKDI